MNPKIWRDRTTHETKGGWWYSYWHPMDKERLENGPFETFDEAEEALLHELDDLSIETEGRC